MTQIKPVQQYPALLLQENNSRALVVCDLHIGWERLLSQKGLHDPVQTSKIKNMLHKLIKETKLTPILLGEIKDAYYILALVTIWCCVIAIKFLHRNRVQHLQLPD